MIIFTASMLLFFTAGCSFGPEGPEDPEDWDDPEDIEDELPPDPVEVSIGVVGSRSPARHPVLEWPREIENPALAVLYPPVAVRQENGTIRPNLAEDIAMSGERELVITLPSERHWTDGARVIPHDLQLALEFMLHPDAAGPDTGDQLDFIRGAEAYRSGEADGIAGIREAREDRIVVELREDTPRALWFLAQWSPLPSHALEDIPMGELADALEDTEYPVLGPFALEVVSGDDGTRWVLQRQGEESAHPEEEGVDDHVDTLRFDFHSEPSADSLSGADVVYVAPRARHTGGEIPGDRTTWARPSADAVEYLGFNTESAFLSDTRVRRAIGYAVDREEVVSALFGEAGAVAGGPLDALLGAGIGPSDGLERDPARAEELLEEAGYGADGTRIPELYALYPAEDPGRHAAMEQIRRDLDGIGITVHLVPSDRSLMLYTIYGRGRYDMYLLARPVAGLACPSTWAGDNPWHYAVSPPNVPSFEFLLYGEEDLDRWEWMEEMVRDVPALFLGSPTGEISALPDLPKMQQGVAPVFTGIEDWTGFSSAGN